MAVTPSAPAAAARLRSEPTRARYPDEEGYAGPVFWERYGLDEPDVVLVPPSWPYVYSRAWKAQIPYLARHFGVVAFDPRGNGRSDRPTDAAAYSDQAFAADTLAVMDAVGARDPVLVVMSVSVPAALRLAAEHPERVRGLVGISSMFPVGRWRALSLFYRLPMRLFFMRPLSHRWLLPFNARNLRDDFPGMMRWVAERDTTQPHSTRQRECAAEWGLQSEPEAFVAATTATRERSRAGLLGLARRVRCPVLVIHGTHDRWFAHADARALAKATGGRLFSLNGGDHAPAGRRPVAVNLALREFIDECRA